MVDDVIGHQDAGATNGATARHGDISPAYEPAAGLIHRGRNIAFDPSTDDLLRGGGMNGVPGEKTQTATTSEFSPIDLTWAKLTFDVPRKTAATKTKKPSRKDRAKAKAADAAATSAAGAKGNGTAGSSTSTTDDDPAADSVTPAPSSPTDQSAATGSANRHHGTHAASDADETFLVPDMNGTSAGPSRKRVLHGINGTVRAGQFLAIMGASGAGKSTLLNLLAGRIESSKGCRSGGSVLLNGKKRNFDEFTKISCYVEQEDVMFPELTVQEQITYAALLRLPGRMSRERKLLRVESVIQELGLSKARNTVIGDELIKGISGGERKRVSIATELVADASLLFLDEPTTGLDAFNALNVMTSLRHLASNGRTVISTIHQPRSSIFHLFDLLCVLSEGRVVFFGHAQDASSYFASLGFRAPAHFNIADYVIDAVSIDYRSKKLEANTKHRVMYLAKEYSASSTSANALVGHDDLPHGASGVESETAIEPTVKRRNRTHIAYPNNFVAEYTILFRRALKKFSRENVTNLTRLFQTIFFGVLLGIIWLNTGRQVDSAEDRRSVLGVLFFLAVNQGFDGAFSVIFQFVIERAVIQRERTSGAYRTITYFASSLALGIMKVFIVNIIFLILVYWMVGLRASAGAFFFALLTNMTIGLTGEGFSQAISVFTGSAQITSALVPLIVVLAFLFAGFFIPKSSMPGVVSWGQNLSFLYWGYNALAKNEFGSRSDNISLSILGTLNDYSRWANYGFVLLFACFAKGLFLFSLYVRRPKFDKTL